MLVQVPNEAWRRPLRSRLVWEASIGRIEPERTDA